MERFDTYLSGEFQPSLFMDFGEGKLFSNKFAESLRPFPMMSGKTINEGETQPNGQYLYTKDGTKTDNICPRCAMSIGGGESNNVKVDMSRLVFLRDDGILFYRDDAEPLTNIGYRPSVICMPQYYPISHNGVVYSPVDKIRPVDGELYTIVVQPTPYLISELQSPKATDWVTITGLIRRTSVLLCADRRRFIAGAYNSVEYCPEDNYQDIDTKCKFKLGDEFCDFISLGVGSIIKMRCVVDVEVIDGKDVEMIYWVVENHNVFEPLAVNLSVDVENYYDENTGRIEYEYNTYVYDGTLYASRHVVDVQRKISGTPKYVDLKYWLSDNLSYDWRDRVIDAYGYDDYYG